VRGVPNRTADQKEAERLLFGPEFRSAVKELAFARLTPLEVMHAVMFIKISKADYDGAIEIAEKAAPFCHPRLNAAEVRVQHSLAVRTDEELSAHILALREKLALVKQDSLLAAPVLPVIDAVNTIEESPASELFVPSSEHMQIRGQNRGQDDTYQQLWQTSAAFSLSVADDPSATYSGETT
jgi:hypothetical protein